MVYGSWDMEHDRHNFYVILDYVLPFLPPKNLENQNLEKMKQHLEILSFYTSAP